MTRPPAGSFAPSLAALLAAGLSPFLVGASWGTALAAGSVVCLATGAVILVREGQSTGVASFHLLAGGLLLLSALPAVLLLPSRPLVLGGIGALAGAILSAYATVLLSLRWHALGEEITTLRARLARREGDVRAQADRIRRLDLIDPITGVANRRGFGLELEQALVTAEHESHPLALLLIELPEALPSAGAPDTADRGRHIGRAIQQAVRGSDAAGRWERNLLALLLPDCQDTGPAVVRLRRTLASIGAGEEDGTRLAGITIAPNGPWPDSEGLMAASQAALSAARTGPDRAEVPVWPIDWGLASINMTHPLSS